MLDRLKFALKELLYKGLLFLSVMVIMSSSSAVGYYTYINDNIIKISGEINGYTELAVLKDLQVTNFIVTDEERALVILNSPGGYADSGKKIVRALDESQVVIDTFVPNHAASAAADIFIVGEKRYVTKDTIILFHGGHLGTYALTEATMANAIYQLEHGRLKEIILAMVNGGRLSDLTFEEAKAVDTIMALMGGSGLSGFEQTLYSMYDSLRESNNFQVDIVYEHIKDIKPEYTREFVRLVVFGNFEKDVTFTGQQLVDMGIAEFRQGKIIGKEVPNKEIMWGK